MAQQSNVPKFGNWESNGNTPYTAYFEKARDKKTSVKTRNLNNPEEKNPRMFSNNVALGQAPPFQMDTESGAQKGRETLRTKQVRSTSRENDRRLATDSPPLHHYGSRSSGDTAKRAILPTSGLDNRIEHSPLQPHHQTRLGGKGNGGANPTWERKGSAEGSNNFAPSTVPVRSRLGSVTRGHETADHGAAVPRFGDWDETNPASADGFTHVFELVREEKLNNRAGQVQVAATQQNSHSNTKMQHDNEMSKRSCRCFSWFGK